MAQNRKTWEDLRDILNAMLDAERSYFQPPSSIKLTYPCIIFNIAGVNVKRADNTLYGLKTRYDLLYITKKADDGFAYDLLTLPYCNLDRTYVADNLYHYAYTLYF